MKTITTNNFLKLSSDLKDFPTLELPNSVCKEHNAPRKKKKKKKLYQLNTDVEDIGIRDLRGRE